MTPPISAALAFGAMFFLDLVYAFYTVRTAEKRPLASASWATLLAGLSAINTIVVVNDPRFLPFTLCGAFLGTLLGVRSAR